MSLTKKFANAVRTRTGQKPLIVTTSAGTKEFQTQSPIVEWITKRDSTMTETLPYYFTATATEGLKKPEQQLWSIEVNIANGRFHQNVTNATTYERMLDIMKHQELKVAREAGVTGSDDEITAKRRQAVPRNNILKFAK
jgi:hypothetical protein